MRILQVGTGFEPVLANVTGGVERYIHYLSLSLASLGHRVTVIDMPTPSRQFSGYQVAEVPILWRHDFNAIAHAFRGLAFGLQAARQIERLLRNDGVDVVNFHTQFASATGMSVTKRYGVPSVFTMHNPLWSDEAACQSRLQKAKFWLEQRAEADADVVIELSRHIMRNRVQYFRLPSEKAELGSVGVDEFWFRTIPVQSSVADRFNLQDAPMVLVVGRIAPYKNQIALALALPSLLKAVPNVRIVFVGRPSSSSYFNRVCHAVSAASAARNVIFAGVLPVEELAQLYTSAQVFVIPSLQENCPQALLEAMAQAKAILAADIPPLREVLSEDSALFAPPTDSEAIAAVLIRLLQDGGLRKQLGTRARARAGQVHRWELVAERVARIYARCSGAASREGERA